jgi:hypothetical protein
MLRTKVHKLRASTRHVAFRIFRWAFWAGVICALICILIAPARPAGVRAVFVFFGASNLGFTAHFALTSADALLDRDYITAVGMIFFTALCAFIVFIGFHTALVGLRAH